MSSPIIHVIQHQQPSGAEVAHLPLMLSDPDPLLACPPGSATERFARGHGIRTVPLPYRSLRQSAGTLEILRSIAHGFTSARNLRGILKQHPDRTVVVGNTLTPSLLAAVAAVGLRRKVVWVGAQRLRHPLVRAGVKLVARLTAAAIIVPSRSVLDEFVGRSVSLRRRTHVVAPGIDVAAFSRQHANRDAVRAALVGYIAPIKRTDLALEIAARVAERITGFELLIVGTAIYTPQDAAFERHLHERVATDAVLRSHIRFCGHVQDVPAVLADVSVLLHCCPSESFGIALVEAMAAGLPVVAPDSGGPLDIVEHGRTGLLYPASEPSRAADYLVRVLSDPVQARAMGAAGRARALERYTARAYVTRFNSVLEGVRDAA